ncbi:MAG TPA: GNAT family N-acetyltransferase [Solirubrobacterales bacterium]|nr:GNAT family N-acetyltransferase [Solirubrobacterales bacterium]
MLRVYAGVREPELEAAGMPLEQRQAFVAHQFEAQSQAYAAYRDTSFEVVLVDGEPAGRLIVARWPEELRVVDVALLPEHRGRGIGGKLIRDLVEEAEERGVKTSIHVERFNPAQRLYARLGFRAVSEAGVYLLLERPARSAAQAKKAS